MSTTTSSPPPPTPPAKESTPESTMTTQSAPEPEPTFDRQIKMLQPPSNAPARGK